MPNSLAKISKVLKPLGGKSDGVVAIKFHYQEISITETRQNSRDTEIVTLGRIQLPRPVDLAAIQHSQDMIIEAIRTLKEQVRPQSVDASIIIPGQIIQVRQINLPYLSPKEIARETKDMGFWTESEPDLEKYTDPVVSCQVLTSSEDDDLTRILLAFGERARIQPWIDIVLAAHFNPVFIESDVFSLANLRFITLPVEDQRQGQIIIQLDRNFCQCVAFTSDRMHRIKLEISEFDLVLLDQAGNTTSLEGEFWEEVAGRVANIIRQAILYLKEEQDFEPPSKVYLVSEYDRSRSILPLLGKKLDLVSLCEWDPCDGVILSPMASSFMEGCANTSRMASLFGASLQRLGIYGEKRDIPFSLNMLPRYGNLRKNRQISVITKTFSLALGISILLLSLWTMGLVLPRYIQSERVSRDYQSLEFTSNQIKAQTDKAMADLRQISHDIEIMRALQSTTYRTTFLKTLPDLLPERVELATLEMTQDHEVTITGFARVNEAVANFHQELQESGFLDMSTVEFAEDGRLITFTINGRLRNKE